jgi:hypothetical protein
MKNKLLFTLLFVFVFPLLKGQTQFKTSEQMMLYGIAYKKCGNQRETYLFHMHKLVNIKEYTKKMRDKFEIQLKEMAPGADRVRISTSKFDFGPSASNMCIIKWVNNFKDCDQEVLYFAFDTTEEGAYNRAIKQKNIWAENVKKTQFSIVESKYW